MTYCIYSNAKAWDMIKECDTLEEAIKYVKSRKTKHGHMVLDSEGNLAYKTNGTTKAE